MVFKFAPLTLSLLALLSLCNCVSFPKTTVWDIPKIDSEMLRPLRLDQVPTRTISIEVTDKRDLALAPQTKDPGQTSVQLTQYLEETVRDSLTRSGFQVTPHALNKLLISVHDQGTNGEINDQCVKLDGTLNTENKKWVKAESLGCFGYQGTFKKNAGSDISKAYVAALNRLYEELDQRPTQ
jgi:uncharacterized lipoprotein YajG